MKRNIDTGLLIFRLTLGILMLMHGIHKLINGVDGIKVMLAEVGLPGFLAYGVHLGETIAALLMIIGFRTRLAAIAYTGVMVVAFLMAHIDPLFALGKSGKINGIDFKNNKHFNNNYSVHDNFLGIPRQAGRAFRYNLFVPLVLHKNDFRCTRGVS